MKTPLHAWILVAVCCLTLMVTNGMTLTGLSAFDAEILAEFGWGRGELKLREFITFGVVGLSAPLFGALADRYGTRPLLVGGALALALGLFLYSRLTSLAELYAIHTLFGLSLAAAGIVITVMLVSKWFPVRSGLALGLTVMGTSLGNSVLPLVNTRALAAFGWREAFFALSALPLALAVILALTVREPAAATSADAASPGARAPKRHATRAETLAGFRDILRQPAFWVLGVLSMLAFYAILGVSSHLFLFLKGGGFSPEATSGAIGLMFMVGLVGKVIAGAAADVVGSVRMLRLCLGVMAAGGAFLVATAWGGSLGTTQVFLALGAFGLGWGGFYTLLLHVAVGHFGLRASGKVLGTLAFLDAIGGGLGPWLTGVLFDRSQSYLGGFGLIAGLVCVAFVLALFLRSKAPVAAAEPALEPSQASLA